MASDFRKDLIALLNAHGIDNQTNTPDYLLGDYLLACLKAFDSTVQARDTWHSPTKPPTEEDTDA